MLLLELPEEAVTGASCHVASERHAARIPAASQTLGKCREVLLIMLP